MLKAERREIGGSGEGVFRFLGGNCPVDCVLLGEPSVDLPSGMGVIVSGASLLCATLSLGLGADVCRFSSFAVSDPRFGRRRLPDFLAIQLPGDENVIEIERFVRLEGVSSGVEVG